jgi:hexosaminidase
MRLIISCFSLFCFLVKSNAQTINIIPQPVEMKTSISNGKFLLSKNTTIILTHGTNVEKFSELLNEYLQSYYGFKLTVRKLSVSTPKSNIIVIGYNQLAASDDKACSYSLKTTKSKIALSSRHSNGLFYSIQTLIQLLPIEKNKILSIPEVEIYDYPRFAYRGMHLDVARHFSSVAVVKKYIDLLALHKLNTFHWHLTDDQGWRIEIKKYPKLTEVGAKRNGTIIDRYPGTGNDNTPHGGFYTQEQIKEVVKYAADRYITVIPEIEMPGHASAAIAAYPQLSCFPDEKTVIPENMISKTSTLRQAKGGKKLVQETWGVFEDVFCPSEYTFNFLQDVLDEVMSLFPSQYIHIGGDECPKEAWKRSAFCQQLIKEKELKDEHGLQSYFIQRIEKYLNSKGRKIIGWDEILEGGLAPNATVMSWRGEQGGIDAAKQKHDVIMTPGNPVYFDHTQSSNEDSVTIGGYNPIEKVYVYEPIPKELNGEEAKYVLGAQANLWTEYIKNPSKLEYMLLPRLAALSEVLWSPKEKNDWDGFEKRLQVQFKRYDLWKVNYSKAYFDLKATIIPTEDYNGVRWKIQSKYSNANCGYCYIAFREQFTYTKDTILRDTVAEYSIHDPTKLVKYHYLKEVIKKGDKGVLPSSQNNIPDTVAILDIKNSKSVVVWQSFHHSKSENIVQQFHFNKATGKKITLTSEASNNYPGDGAFTLVNGVQNEKGLARSREFLGFNGTDCEAIIDLGKTTPVSNVVIHSLHQKGSWIWRPQTLEVFSSADGINFSVLGLTDDFLNTTKPGNGTMTVSFNPVETKFIKIKITNWGEIPAGEPGAGNKPWLFVDEVEIN